MSTDAPTPAIESSVSKLLDGETAYYVSVVSYMSTHGCILTLAIHTGNYLSHVRVRCEGVFFFHGNTQAGPFPIVVREESDESSGRHIAIVAEGETFVVRCMSARIAVARSDDFREPE